MNIVECIKQGTAQHAAKTAVIDGDCHISYGQLLSSADMIASDLGQKGVNRFHHVGLICYDDIDYISTSLAVLSLNAVIIPISPEQTRTEIEHVIDRIDVDFLIFEHGRYHAKDASALNPGGFYKKTFFYSGKSGKETTRKRLLQDQSRLHPFQLRNNRGQQGDCPVS